MKKNLGNICLGLVMILSAVPALPAMAVETDDLPPSITVTGEGHVFTKPDMAQLSIGVVSEAKTAQQALQANKAAMSALLKTLGAKGVPEKDILTSNFSVNPQYHYENRSSGTPAPPAIIGYNVSNSVQTKIRDLAKLGDILDAVVGSGANTVNGINFSVAEPAPLLDEARRKAVADCQRKAQVFASAAGIKTGRVLYVNESGGMIAPPRPMMMMARAESSQGGVPISTGEQELTASVTMIFAIDGPRVAP